MPGPILETDGLSFHYGGRERAALRDVGMAIERGSRTAIMGANGAGKSTLFYHFNGVLRPSDGTVSYDGRPLRYGRRALRALRSDVAVVLQNPDDQIFCSTVEEDVAFGPRNMGLPESEVRERVEEALFQTGLAALRSHGTLRLSYGQRKRLALAGALAMRPGLLVLDEPTSGLDPQMAHEAMEIAEQLHHAGTTVVISTHDVDLAYEWADGIRVLLNGTLMYSGVSEGFFSDPKLVHMAGLMPPSMYSMNRDHCLMSGTDPQPYPRSLPELIAKLSGARQAPGRMAILSVSGPLSEGDLSNVKTMAGGARIGVYGTAARRAVFDGQLYSDFVFNGIDRCLMENVRGMNSILCCEDAMVDAVLRKLDRLEGFGCRVERDVIEARGR